MANMFVRSARVLHGGAMNENQHRVQHVDVAVVGGGAAGLSAGLVLARSLRSVVVIDAGEQRNLPAGHVHNFLTSEGWTPGEIVATGRAEVESYGGEVIVGRVVEAVAQEGDHPSFVLGLDDGRSVHARRVVIAAGATDRLPDVPGLAERWGRDVLHCPYCHGWEVRGRRIGVLATSPNALHQVGLFRQLSEHVTLVAGDVELDHHALMNLRVRGVDVVRETAAEVLVTDDRLSGVRLRGGEVLELDALVVAPFFEARADVATQLGLAVKELEM
ncbi:MAG: NAD(P)/FAD-dependent oxidoreductase, partial [Actinomycetales bacterium]